MAKRYHARLDNTSECDCDHNDQNVESYAITSFEGAREHLAQLPRNAFLFVGLIEALRSIHEAEHARLLSLVAEVEGKVAWAVVVAREDGLGCQCHALGREAREARIPLHLQTL